MKTNNQHLKGIAKNTGSEVSGHHTDNYYLKRIDENTNNSNFDTLEIEITYEDDSTDTMEIYIVPQGD